MIREFDPQDNYGVQEQEGMRSLSTQSAISLVSNILYLTQSRDEYIDYFTGYVHAVRPDWRIDPTPDVINGVYNKVMLMAKAGKHDDAYDFEGFAKSNVEAVAEGLSANLSSKEIFFSHMLGRLVEADIYYMLEVFGRPGVNSEQNQSRICSYILGEGLKRKRKILRIVGMSDDKVFDNMFDDLFKYLCEISPADNKDTMSIAGKLVRIVAGYNEIRPTERHVILPSNLVK